MDDDAKGGSYLRQPDGWLKLVSRTEEPTPETLSAPDKPVSAKAAKPAKES